MADCVVMQSALIGLKAFQVLSFSNGVVDYCGAPVMSKTRSQLSDEVPVHHKPGGILLPKSRQPFVVYINIVFPLA